MEGGESFDPSSLGTADEVIEERVADDDVIMIKGAKSSRAVSFISNGKQFPDFNNISIK